MHFLNSITLTATLAQYAYGWGGLGHQTVAYIAYDLLTPGTKSYVDNILTNDKGFDFGDASLFADVIRRQRPWTKPWHFIDGRDKPPKQCGIAYPDDCGDNPTEGCVITAIANQTAIFTDTRFGDDIRKEALMFLVHFIGDLHQPLHTEDAFRGGNELPVCFGRACSGVNLHSVWDTYIPSKIAGISHAAKAPEQKEAAKSWAGELRAAATGVDALAECHDIVHAEKCSLLWARETNKLICSFVMKEPTDWLESNDLSLEYYDGAKPIVEKAITKAGFRLAAWLEAVVAAAEDATEGEKNFEL